VVNVKEQLLNKKKNNKKKTKIKTNLTKKLSQFWRRKDSDGNITI